MLGRDMVTCSLKCCTTIEPSSKNWKSRKKGDANALRQSSSLVTMNVLKCLRMDSILKKEHFLHKDDIEYISWYWQLTFCHTGCWLSASYNRPKDDRQLERPVVLSPCRSPPTLWVPCEWWWDKSFRFCSILSTKKIEKITKQIVTYPVWMPTHASQ